ncbi:hypothetical protein Mal15_35430 [Stieleria maiorica]|uniref:Glycosyltransferase family 1 protein n=1 Tax=Stieleria maiorica TaxID=2795974 RepID=A0A5B9MEF3_9BACT|nr:hypothetical protein [Stieleria maiorica]QEF99478.1 hypothetical protein Mal15_35430 [Stieleria maiorica]
MSRVIHVCPRAIFANTYHGSYKDTISRIRFLESSGCDYHQVVIDADDPDAALGAVSEIDAANILIEYSRYPRVLKALRERFPAAYIAVRSHNLEPLQHLDNLGWFPSRGPLWMLYGMTRLFRNDLIAKKNASAIWSISDWENRVYWNRLPGHAEVRWLPYHCPEHLVSKHAIAVRSRKIVACMPTSQKNRKSWDLVCQFIAFAEQMTSSGFDELDFVVTGDVASWGLPPSTAVRYSGMIEDLADFLGKTRAVAMLSGLGYGFKTTLGDAVANGASVIVHPRLYQRLPEEMKADALACDPNRAMDCDRIFRWMQAQTEPSSLLQRHREQVAEALDQLLQHESVSR